MRGAEVNGEPGGRGPELVVVGHVGTSIVHAGAVSWTVAGGSGYAAAASAGALIGRRAGLVATVGKDFDLDPLRSRRVDLDGVTELAGAFLALRAEGLPERTALTYAVRAAASCAADYGVTGSHLTAELEVIRREAGEYSAA